MCGQPRDKVCRCLDRGGKQIDPIHTSLAIADEYISTERYFGSEKHEIALALISDAVSEIVSKVAAKQLQGFVLVVVNRDAERLERKAKGRLFATRSAMAEREQTQKVSTKTNNDDVMSRLRQRRALAANQL